MKASAARLYACPACRGDLALRGEQQQGGEIMAGALECRRCAVPWPIARGVPRFVATEAYASSFGRQWRWFRTVQIDSRNGTRESQSGFGRMTGWRPEELRGRLVLDAGVGAGRYAEVAAEAGAEVVGVDLSTAIDAAYENVGRRDRVHLAQADIFRLPFRDGTFDAAYAIGVLHHTPDVAAAFRRVAATVRADGGELAVYLYARYGITRPADLARRVTTRLPARVAWALAAGAVPAYYAYRLPIAGKLLRIALPISMHPDWRWRWLDTFDWYTPRYQWKLLYPEVFRWFRECGFSDVDLLEAPITMRGRRPPAAAEARSADAAE